MERQIFMNFNSFYNDNDLLEQCDFIIDYFIFKTKPSFVKYNFIL